MNRLKEFIKNEIIDLSYKSFYTEVDEGRICELKRICLFIEDEELLKTVSDIYEDISYKIIFKR